MLLNDSLDFEAGPPFETSPLRNAELVPMIKWHDIQLSNIWIPSKLFNQQRFSPPSSNEHKSVICRTLVKHKTVDSFSIYSETETSKSNFNSSEKLLDSLEELPPKYQSTQQTQLQKVKEWGQYSCSELPSDCNDAIESEYAVDVNKENRDIFLEDNCNSPSSSIADYLEHLNISDDEDENSLNRIINKPDQHETSAIAQGDSNVVELSVAYDEKILTELVCDMPVKTDTCSLNDNEIQNYENSVAASSFSDPDQMVDLFELSEKLWNDSKLNSENSSVEKENPYQTEITHNSFESIVPPESSEFFLKTDDLNKIESCPEEELKIEKFLFLLERSNDEDLSFAANSGKSSKKEKRIKKKAPKNIPLDNFFCSKEEEAASSDPPAYLEFIKNLDEKLGYPDIFKKSESGASSIFPTLTDMTTVEECKRVENNSLCHIVNPVLESPSFNCNIDQSVVQCDSNLTKYVIENIPPFVNEEMLLNIIVSYGDIKKVVMKHSGGTLKAVIMMSVEDPSWMIECLNGDQPFGASADGGLKCYQIL